MLQNLLNLLIETDWTARATKDRQAIAIGHCTRLTTLTTPELREVQAQITRHDLPVHFVGLPTSDLLMMGCPEHPPPPGQSGGPIGDAHDRGGTTTTTTTTTNTPMYRPRGTLQVISMIRDWGLDACVGVNNVGNPFTPHGSGDPLQLACWGAGLYHAGTAGGAELLYECVSGRAMRAVGLEPEEAGLRGLGSVPYPGLLVENPGFDELPGADPAAGDSILVPSRRRLGVKDVVWDPPTSRRIVRYDSKVDLSGGKTHRGNGNASA